MSPGLKTEFFEQMSMDFCADLKNWTALLLATDDVPLVHSVSYGWQRNLSQVQCTPDKTTDLYEKTFGRRPDLTPAIGSKGVERGIYGPSTLSGLSKSLRAELPAL